MIVVSLFGGLGNQMFQYALARDLSIRFNTDLKYDYSINLNRNDFKPGDISFIYDVFNVVGTSISPGEINSLDGALLNEFLYIKESSFNYDSSISDRGDNVYLQGYWQSEKYFTDVADIIKNDFSIVKPISQSNLKIFEEISSSNSVSIHIRGRDYINNKDTAKVHNTCDLKYYNSAIDYICTHIDNPYFYIFSDDLEWAMALIKNKIDHPHCFITGNSWNDNAFDDLRLMSICKNNIIANSSFSWWAAWLNKNPNKKVIAPKNWFAIDEMNRMTGDLIPCDWIKL